MDTTPQAVIDARVHQFRQALEAVAAEGIDPAEAAITTYRKGDILIQAGMLPEDVALRILARLADGEPTRRDHPNCVAPFSSYQTGDVRVHAELYRDDTDGAR